MRAAVLHSHRKPSTAERRYCTNAQQSVYHRRASLDPRNRRTHLLNILRDHQNFPVEKRQDASGLASQTLNGVPIARYYALSNRLLRVNLSSLIASNLLSLYRHSPTLMIMTEFPEHAWKPWNFSKTPRGWWEIAMQSIKSSDPVGECSVREFVEQIEAELGIRRVEDWNAVQITYERGRQLSHLGGINFVLGCLYPQYRLHILQPTPRVLKKKKNKLSLMSSKHWKNIENRRAFIEEMVVKEKIIDKDSLPLSSHNLDVLYNVTLQQFIRHGGLNLVCLFNRSVPQTIINTYPEHDWKYWKFRRSENGWWIRLRTDMERGDPKAISLVKEYLEEHLGMSPSVYHSKKYNIANMSSTDRVRIMLMGGLTSVFKRVYGELPNISVSNTEQVKPTLAVFMSGKKVRPSFWTSKENIVTYLNFLKQQLGGTFESMYNVSKYTFKRTGGGTLLNKYKGSAYDIMVEYFPQHKWLEWKFRMVPKNWWSYPKNRRAFLLHMSDYSFESMYSINTEKIPDEGGRSILSRYQNSVSTAVLVEFPEVAWKPWKFSRTAHGWWSDLIEALWNGDPVALVAVQDLFQTEVENILGIKSLSDWYTMRELDREVLALFKAISRTKGRWSVIRDWPVVLLAVYPHHSWDTTKFHFANVGISQQKLKDEVEELIPRSQHAMLNIKDAAG